LRGLAAFWASWV